MRGRGTPENPANRFDRLHIKWEDGYEPSSDTRFLVDRTSRIVTSNDSPDIGYDFSLNPYRGCEHGCIYCYARPTHEYLGYSPGLDFETRILVKTEAATLLRRELGSPRWSPAVVALSGVTDPYQPVERRLRRTRGCLEVLAEFRNPVTIITKNHLITRDLDVLSELNRFNAASARVSMTTMRADLHRVMEPRTSSPPRRLDAIEQLARRGIPVGVMVAPVIPGLNDHEIPEILKQARLRGAITAHFQIVRLPYAVKDLFISWLREHFPDRADRVINRIQEVRAGRLNDSRFFHRMRGEGEYAGQIQQLFERSHHREGFRGQLPPLSCASFRREGQLRLPWD
jgi:DNA repair photolyase